MLALVEEEGIHLEFGRREAASLPEVFFSTSTLTSIVPGLSVESKCHRCS